MLVTRARGQATGPPPRINSVHEFISDIKWLLVEFNSLSAHKTV